MSHTVFIVAAQRTPMGAFQGALSELKGTELGACAIEGVLSASSLSPNHVDEVIMGCVLPAGLGQAPARQAALKAGVTFSTPCTTVNKVCGSGMKAVMNAWDQIALGLNQVMIAGGMESMSNAPYLLDRARGGYRLGHGKVMDHMFHDGLEDPYHENRLMGTFADDTAKAYGFTRADQDAFALESLRRSQEALKTRAFNDEVVAVGTKKETVIQDETPQKVKADKIPTLKPAFGREGTVTAANASSIADGAAALLLMSENAAQEKGLSPLAVMRGHATFAQAPEWFTTAPAGAIKKVCEQVGWSLDEIDLFEINEAFAVVTMAAMKDLGIPHNKVNVLGGACALGHPIGATGARLIVTLAHALKNKGLKKGVASLCLGGGEATAVAIEIV